MDKRIIQNFAVWAKANLESQIEVSLKAIGINGDKDIRGARRVGDVTIIEGDANSYPASLFGKRERIINDIRQRGYQNIIEEFAYTWFNRIIALRYMELHDFLPHGFRVLSSRDGGIEPEILKNLAFVKEELGLDMAQCATLQSEHRTEELFRYVLLHQCNALADILPMLFAKDSDYLELLLPKSLLIGDTVVTRLLQIPEENFLDAVEIIGWMYQFYISAKKDAVFASKATITKDTLPAVTQLFTPEWIVRYMAENSVGRLWLESYPTSPLRHEMRYFVEEAEQTPEVQRQLEAIRYRNVNPEDLRVIEPCVGSGHIANVVFDLLYKMYEEKGYAAREIPTLILKKNLIGLDVDKRAAQLASFALVMKARGKNSRFFSENYYTLPQVYELLDSQRLEHLGYQHQMSQAGCFTPEEQSAVKALVETFRYGKTIGSLTKVPPLDFSAIESAITKLETQVVETLFNGDFLKEAPSLLKALLRQAKILSSKYDVMITNPPYIGLSTMELPVKEYAAKHYPDSKTDLCTMFIERGLALAKANGIIAMITMHSWMFLSSFEKLRREILNNDTILTMVHLGARAFDTIGGEVVQTTAFTMTNTHLDGYKGAYVRLVDGNSETEKEQMFIQARN